MDAWVGILAILVGLVSCFCGYPLFRTILILAGFIGGYLIGQSFVQTGHEWLALVAGITTAILMAVLAYPLWSFSFFLVGAALGIIILGSIAIVLNSSQAVVILFGVLGAVVVGFLFYQVRDLFVMLTTALNGAVEVVYGIGLLIPALAFRYGAPNFLALAAVFVLGSLGFGVQFRMFKDRRTYSREAQKQFGDRSGADAQRRQA
jgi:hypothetical protein